MEINEIQEEIIEEFQSLEDWMDKYQLLIDIGNELPPLEEQYKKPEYLIEGCQSRVWIHAQYDGQLITLEAESDTVIVKGIIALLVRVLSGRTPDEILNANLFFIDAIGLKDHLSPTRSNGLVSMIRQINQYARVFKLRA
ncbi:MAG: SufE family protein [Bacteroidales bacterium]|jgi:cysteine desulfuration protein SufE|nr:SufE family protein [Bacteroidales bacterium]MDD3166311.1 SufE family protein [Bacteroidales bacterium]MDD4771388.1 SufE family protein [Bacteroidales bacterium]HKL92955.1 SufE family protein [Bacteroidales bacterium]